jgi:flagellar biogenesis protein FliO
MAIELGAISTSMVIVLVLIAIGAYIIYRLLTSR